MAEPVSDGAGEWNPANQRGYGSFDDVTCGRGRVLGETTVPAWPYGLVVAVQENGVRASGDDERIRRNREELVRLLEKAGVKVDLWPSA